MVITEHTEEELLRTFRPVIAFQLCGRIRFPAGGLAAALWPEFFAAREAVASEAGGGGSLSGMRGIEIACALPRGGASAQGKSKEYVVKCDFLNGVVSS